MNKKTGIFSNPDDEEPFDYLEEGSIVKILAEAEEEYVRVDYFGNIAYIKTSNLVEE